MNYYPHHIGDFRSGTVNMSRVSRWIYRDMMDVYYDTEKPLPLDLDVLCDMLGVEAEEERGLVERLLRFKFSRTESGYCHKRCEEEIAAYHSKAETAKANGKLGGRPRKANGNPTKPSGFPSGSNPEPSGGRAATGSEANQEPRTNINSVPNGTGGEPPGLDPKDALFQIAVPWLVDRGVKEANARSLLGAASKKLGSAGAWDLASSCMTEKPLDPATWIAGALNKQIGKTNGATRYGNFASQDYRAGVAADGSF